MPDGSMILILGNIYGTMRLDAGGKIDAVITSIDFTRSTFDVCVYSLRRSAGNLEGILCVHVDDTICGGSGPLFSKALQFAPSFSIS